MRIGSGVQSAPEVFGKRQNNSKTSAVGNEKFSQTSVKVYLKTDDMLFSGGNGTGLSFYIKYAEESTEDNPVVIAKGIDENGKEFEEKININDIDLRNASYVEMSALEAYCSCSCSCYGTCSCSTGQTNNSAALFQARYTQFYMDFVAIRMV